MAAAAAAAGAAAEGIHNPITDGARAMFDPQREYMDYELLKALQSGDRRTVERFFPQEVSMAIVPYHVTNIADQAGRRSSRGVTVGGNSALHIAADFGHLEFAELICTRDSSFLRAHNVAGETPLHCAARAGADQIVSHFISVAKEKEDGSWLEAVLHAKDQEGKTALYTAAQEGHAAAAKVLMNEDPGLAAIVDNEGVSPLYVAVLSGSLEIVQILIGSRADGGDTPDASYAGPNGQTALHAAAMIENPEITEKLLKWKSILTKEVDSSKSTPLHYLATTSNYYMMCQLLKHDTYPAYFSDSKGLCPIHVASRMGRLPMIRELINCCPDMGELVDDSGRNFLHVAIQHGKANIVWFVCRSPLFVRITNARDCEGNTPLHLAVKFKNQTIVSLLLKNKSVRPSIMNKNGKTPLDLAIAGHDVGMYLKLNPGIWIFRCLKGIGAIYGPHRSDLLVDEMITKLDQEKELRKYKTTTQSLAIVSVLIATVTFAAAFTMPEGYKADDHQNGGTPTLATKYAFKAFIFSDSLAFICSILATISLIYAGSLTTDPSLRMKFIVRFTPFLSVAAHGMVIAFTMAMYVVLAPVNTGIVITICTLSFTSVLFYDSSLIWPVYGLACLLRSRLGWLRTWKTRVARRPDGEYFMGNIYYFIFRQVVSGRWYSIYYYRSSSFWYRF